MRGLVARPFFYARDRAAVRADPAVARAYALLRDHARAHPPHRADFETVRAIGEDAATFGETPVSVARDLLAWAGVDASSDVVDLGAGRGQVLLAARLLGARARGCELDGGRASCARILAEASVALACGDARAFDVTGATHVVLAWTTWPAALRDEVTAHIRDQCAGARVLAFTHAPLDANVLGARTVAMPWGRAEALMASW